MSSDSVPSSHSISLNISGKSKLDAEKFLSLCVFHNDDLCTSSLEKLVAELAAKENINLSAQGLNDRFNKYSVEFMKQIFNATMQNNSEILKSNGKFFSSNFNRIRIADSTEFVLPKEFQKYYKGFSSKGSESCAKIQLLVQFLMDLMILEYILQTYHQIF